MRLPRLLALHTSPAAVPASLPAVPATLLAVPATPVAVPATPLAVPALVLAFAAVLLASPALAQESATLRQFRAILPPGSTLTFERSAPVAGPEEGITLENVVIARPNNERTTMASLTLVGLRTDGAARIALRDLVAPSPNGPVRVGSLEATGIAIRRRPPGQTQQPDDFKLTSVVVENFSGTARPAFTIARFAMNNWGIGRRTEGEITGISFTGIPDNPIQDATIARLAVSGVDIASIATAAAQSRNPGQQPPGRQTAAIEGVVLRAVGGAALGGLESLAMEGETDAQGSGTGQLAMRGLRVERTPQTAQGLDAVGLDRVEASLTFNGTYDAPAGRLVIPAFALGVRELGAVALALGIDGYTPEAAQRHDLSRVRLLHARLRYADQSLYRRAVRAQAQRAGGPGGEQAIRDQHAQAVSSTLASATPNPALDALRDVLLRFIRGEINIVELQAQPAQPVPVMSLGQTAQQGPGAITRQLNVTARGERAP